MNVSTKPRIRCAIYTRKSSDEGLEQEYNSLDAQRDASEAYIASQRHEGWMPVGDLYDDGGFSGGNMNRPGLKRLMADIEARKIDIVVVYKIDRLTRSLMDFAQLIAVFDKQHEYKFDIINRKEPVFLHRQKSGRWHYRWTKIPSVRRRKADSNWDLT